MERGICSLACAVVSAGIASAKTRIHVTGGFFPSYINVASVPQSVWKGWYGDIQKECWL